MPYSKIILLGAVLALFAYGCAGPKENIVLNNAKAAYEKAKGELKAKKTDRGFVLTLGDVLFATGKADLMSGAQRTIDQLAGFLNKYGRLFERIPMVRSAFWPHHSLHGPPRLSLPPACLRQFSGQAEHTAGLLWFGRIGWRSPPC
jgi:hypothetical protein